MAEPPSPLASRLLAEARRYLEAVDAFRAEGRPPTWAPEQPPPEWWAREHLPDPRGRLRIA